MIITLIPVYNSEYTIAKVIVNAIKNSDIVLIYDDGSTDSTREILDVLDCIKHLTVYRNSTNNGKGYALKQLFDKTRNIRFYAPTTPIFVTLDSDDQHNPNEISKLIQPILKGEADVVIGIKQLRKTPFIRMVGTIVLDLFYGIGSQSGFRAYNQKALDSINITTDGFAVDQQIVKQLKYAKCRISYVPITIKYNNRSHTTNIFKHFIEIFRGVPAG